jgi:carbon-monoxide dehydrogenase small subunit
MTLNIDINCVVNGRQTALNVPAGMSALDMLRDLLDLKGAKLSCGEGECGACTILVDGQTRNACIMFAVDCDGRQITTIEGLRSKEGLDPMQTAFVEAGAIQCGYCMPGMIMQARYLADTNPGMNGEELRRGLEGNVCRCTGYKKVFDAVAKVTGVEG